MTACFSKPRNVVTACFSWPNNNVSFTSVDDAPNRPWNIRFVGSSSNWILLGTNAAYTRSVSSLPDSGHRSLGLSLSSRKTISWKTVDPTPHDDDPSVPFGKPFAHPEPCPSLLSGKKRKSVAFARARNWKTDPKLALDCIPEKCVSCRVDTQGYFLGEGTWSQEARVQERQKT